MVGNITKIRLLRNFCRSNFYRNSKPTTNLGKQSQHKIPRNSPVHIPQYFGIALVGFFYCAESQQLSNKSGNEKNTQDPVILSTINQSDELFSMGKFENSFKLLEPYKDSGNVEIVWRMSRDLYNMSKLKGIEKSESASLINEGYKYIERALELNDNHYAVHKWMAILVDAKSALDGIKARINTLPLFKEHLMIAVELNPKDATSIYMLGLYMYNIADMSWLQRTIAKTLFGTPPESTFEEALHYFSKAEEVEPNFYSANLLMLGKTYLKLKRPGAARYWLKCALSYPVRTDEDEAVRIEAEELLDKIPAMKNDSGNEEATIQ